MSEFMEHCLRAGRAPRVAAMARMLDLSRERLTREFGAATGRSPAEAFRQLQVRRAQELLATTSLSTGEIARLAGFGSPRAFYRTFLHCAGATPTEFRRLAREG
ncbi:MAG TPA: helix-turn-helix domain-containing protein [Longimicrobium sp.]|jgi:transcriptional regulator GlxA family with amidase domain